MPKASNDPASAGRVARHAGAPMNPASDASGGLGALVGAFGYDREASLLGDEADPAMVLWRIDRPDPLRFEVEVPRSVSLVCAHLTGRITWSCRSERGSYDRPCLPGTLNITRGGTRVALRMAEARADVIHFYIPDRLIADARERDDDTLDLRDPMNAEDRVIADIARGAARALRAGDTIGRLQAQAAGFRLAARILEAHSNHARTPEPQPGGLPPARLRRVLERMGDELRDEPSLIELAGLARIGTKHFARAFKQSTGETAHGWLMRRRLARAQDMLVCAAEPIAEIATACGFADQSHFTAAFRKAMGVTPAAYRRARLA